MVHRGFPGKPDESSKHSSEFGSSIGSCKAGNIKTFAGARPASEQPQAPRLACKQPPTAPPLQRGTISNFCSLCGRLLAGDLSRANAAQQPRKKRSFRLFPEIRDEPFLCLSHLSTTLARACQQAKCLVLVNAIRLQASSHKTIT